MLLKPLEHFKPGLSCLNGPISGPIDSEEAVGSTFIPIELVTL
jgi:hypothetical protein